MTTTPPEAPPGPEPTGQSGDLPGSLPGQQQGPRATRDDIRDLGALRRTTGQDKKLAGVAGGLARHLDVDPLLLRVALVVLVFFGGAGVIVYLACWLLGAGSIACAQRASRLELQGVVVLLRRR